MSSFEFKETIELTDIHTLSKYLNESDNKTLIQEIKDPKLKFILKFLPPENLVADFYHNLNLLISKIIAEHRSTVEFENFHEIIITKSICILESVNNLSMFYMQREKWRMMQSYMDVLNEIKQLFEIEDGQEGFRNHQAYNGRCIDLRMELYGNIGEKERVLEEMRMRAEKEKVEKEGLERKERREWVDFVRERVSCEHDLRNMEEKEKRMARRISEEVMNRRKEEDAEMKRDEDMMMWDGEKREERERKRREMAERRNEEERRRGEEECGKRRKVEKRRIEMEEKKMEEEKKRMEEERKRKEEEERKKREDEKKKKEEEEERKRKEEEVERKKKEEKRRKEEEEEERKKKEEEKKRKEEEEKRKRDEEEEEKKKKIIIEQKRKEMEEKKRKRDEEEKKKRDENKKRAEDEKRKKMEEERKKREEQQKRKMEEMKNRKEKEERERRRKIEERERKKKEEEKRKKNEEEERKRKEEEEKKKIEKKNFEKPINIPPPKRNQYKNRKTNNHQQVNIDTKKDDKKIKELNKKSQEILSQIEELEKLNEIMDRHFPEQLINEEINKLKKYEKKKVTERMDIIKFKNEDEEKEFYKKMGEKENLSNVFFEELNDLKRQHSNFSKDIFFKKSKFIENNFTSRSKEKFFNYSEYSETVKERRRIETELQLMEDLIKEGDQIEEFEKKQKKNEKDKRFLRDYISSLDVNSIHYLKKSEKAMKEDMEICDRFGNEKKKMDIFCQLCLKYRLKGEYNKILDSFPAKCSKREKIVLDALFEIDKEKLNKL